MHGYSLSQLSVKGRDNQYLVEYDLREFYKRIIVCHHYLLIGGGFNDVFFNRGICIQKHICPPHPTEWPVFSLGVSID